MYLEAKIKLNSEMHLDAVIERIWRCIWRPRLCNIEMHFESVIEQVWRCTWRLWSSELRDALEGRDRASLEMHMEAEIKLISEMHLEAVIKQVWRCIWRPWSCNFGMHLEAVIEQVWRCTWRLWSCDSEMHLETWSCEFGDALGGRDRASLEMHLEAMIDRDCRSTRRWSSWRRLIRSEVRWQLRIYALVNS